MSACLLLPFLNKTCPAPDEVPVLLRLTNGSRSLPDGFEVLSLLSEDCRSAWERK
jgi:hypothetical protein